MWEGRLLTNDGTSSDGEEVGKVVLLGKVDGCLPAVGVERRGSAAAAGMGVRARGSLGQLRTLFGEGGQS